MTRQDYDLIAACLGASYARFSKDEVGLKVIDDVKRRLASKLCLQNPQFSHFAFTSRINYWSTQTADNSGK